MIISIDKTHPIFKDPEYIKDIVPFNLIEIIKQSPMLLVSNEKDFIIAISAPQKPVWVWTSEKISSDSLKELCEFSHNEFGAEDSVRFVAKPGIADALVKAFIENNYTIQHRIRMESFENTNLIPAKNQDAVIERPVAEDVYDIAVCMANFEKDCFGKEVSVESLLDEAGSKPDNPWFFVIKENGIVAATVQSSRETEQSAAVNLVYTRPESRGKGYASALAAFISKKILERGKMPVLYTDISNPFSNKAYKNVGFIEKGRVDEVMLARKE